jgi:mannose-6-phosphate isomerase-like protein (cupin superfamily)
LKDFPPKADPPRAEKINFSIFLIFQSCNFIVNILQYKQLAKLLRDNETYKVYDLPELKDLEISLTELHPQKSTLGHSHKNVDEVYIFISGKGTMENGKKTVKVKAGDVVPVKAGNFHRVHNKTDKVLSFWAIFEKYKGRGK